MTTRWIAATVLVLVACGSPPDRVAAGAQAAQSFPATGTLSELLAPIALYPDELVAEVLAAPGRRRQGRF